MTARPLDADRIGSSHLTHWGRFEAETDGISLTAVRPHPDDPEPTPLLDNVASAQHHPARIDRPYVRRGWLENGPGAASRGDDEFVPLAWDDALDLLASELDRVYSRYGGEAVYGGSYGWGSAGRFHHAQSQVHRFLNTLGGYVRHVGSYSFGTAQTLLPHIVGDAHHLIRNATSWQTLAEHTELLVAFGGVSPKNSQVSPGGVSRHESRMRLAALRQGGCRIVSISPLRDDTPPEAEAEWLAPVPGTDTAVMLALAHVLDAEQLVDQDFVARCTVGIEPFLAYIRGEEDGVAKTPEWAAGISGLPVDRIIALAREMAARRTMISVSWSMQRMQHGEQPLWMGLVLAAMLGQIGVPGGGFTFGYGSTADIGLPRPIISAPALPQGSNAVGDFIPVARVADMLLHPGAEYDFDGAVRRYPRIRLIYWCGGNPFHHHQDLARLRRAFGRPDTVVVHDPFWTATARHADIVLPSTMSIERDDVGSGQNDPLLQPMTSLTEPHGEARNDYDAFADLSRRLGRGEQFTEGRDVRSWLSYLYEEWRSRLDADLPGFEDFWNGARAEVPVPEPHRDWAQAFRADPRADPLTTPSGRIEITSRAIADAGYDDCPGHPVWREPEEWLGGPAARDYPLHLIANQPRTRLHSQLDIGRHSQDAKVRGREPLRMHPDDATARGLGDGDIVLVTSPRGSCLAGLRCSTELRPGVVQLSTGAWYDPDPADPTFCRHGNVNVLTADRPSSRLTQGTTGQHCLVQVRRFDGELPDLTVDAAPAIGERPARSSRVT